MACVRPDGTLSKAAQTILRQLEQPLDENEISKKWDKPLFRVRSMIREMCTVNLVHEENGKYQITEHGKSKLDTNKPE